MKAGFVRFAVLAACLVLIAQVSRAQTFSSAHYKAKSVIEEAGEEPVTMESEFWLKGKKILMRTEGRDIDRPGTMKGSMLCLDEKVCYSWQEGASIGFKISFEEGGSSANIVNEIDEIRAKGKKIGTERLDGHVADVYAQESYEVEPFKGKERIKRTMWLARDLSGFPLKVIEESEGSKITTVARDIQVPTSVPDSLLKPPSNVRFREMSDLMKGMPEPKQ